MWLAGASAGRDTARGARGAPGQKKGKERSFRRHRTMVAALRRSARFVSRPIWHSTQREVRYDGDGLDCLDRQEQLAAAS